MLAPKFLQKTTITTKRILMYYLAAMNFMFVYTVLAYSIAVFLQERFEGADNAIFLVGAILGAASFFATFVDVFWTYLQKIRTARMLFMWSICGLALTVSIFLFSQFDVDLFQPLKWAFFTVVAAFTYGWSYDLYEVTMVTYILRKSKSEEFAQNISQKKVAEAFGMLGGLIVGGVIISFGTEIAQVFLLFFLFGLFLFVRHHFDRDEDNVSLKFSDKSGINWKEVFELIAHPDKIATAVGDTSTSLKNEVIALSKETAEKIKDLPENAKKKAEEMLEAARKNLIDILMKEKEIEHESSEKPKFRFHEMGKEVVELLNDFLSILSKNTPLAMFWAIFVVMFFSFWDTMAITFQPIFLGRFANDLGPWGKSLGGVIMGLFILPVFVLQIPFSKLADKYGRYIMILIGISISGLSLLALGLIDIVFGGSFWILLLSGMLNSTGYAAAFSPSQAMFISEHQRHIYRTTGKILSNDAGAAPLRLVLNIGNILGQFGGGLIFAFLGFTSGFLMFGVLLVSISLFSIPFLGKIAHKGEAAVIIPEQVEKKKISTNTN
ncbi:hypothetical protein HZA38_06180 [Candidatus Peregrinibacteria bacterium]|nr:hypothetical protein [Candidatus Peregrinibacteria bacterium]